MRKCPDFVATGFQPGPYTNDIRKIVPEVFVNQPDLVFIDVETSGLPTTRPDGTEDYTPARVVEVAAERVTAWPEMAPVASFEAKILLSTQDHAAASPKALVINGYDEARWRAEGAFAPDDPTPWRRVAEVTRDAVLVGQNINFDRGFLQAELARHGLLARGRVPWQRRVVDVQSFSHLVAGRLGVVERGQPSWGLTPVYRALGGTEVTHRARPDVVAAMFVYRHVQEVYRRAHEMTAALVEPSPLPSPSEAWRAYVGREHELVDELGRLGLLKPDVRGVHAVTSEAGSIMQFRCPRPGHVDVHPSFVVVPKRGYAACLACGFAPRSLDELLAACRPDPPAPTAPTT